MTEVVLENYMVGLIAVACFLVVAFGFVLFNSVVCSKLSIYEDNWEEEIEDLKDDIEQGRRGSSHSVKEEARVNVYTTEL